MIDLDELYVRVAKDIGSKTFSDPKVMKLAVQTLEQSASDELMAAIKRARELADQTQYTRRAYGRGRFFSWPYWESGPLQKVNFGDPWPAQRWPKDVLIFEILKKHINNEVDITANQPKRKSPKP